MKWKPKISSDEILPKKSGMTVEPVTKEKTIVKENTHGDISGAYMQIQISNNKASQNLKAGNMEGI